MKFFKHLNVVLKHKHYVFYYARHMGIFFTGLFHDMSKFSPTEFNRSVKYYAGDKSPTITERQDNDGFSYICAHHVGRNKHHWQYWVDYALNDIVIMRIPYRHNVEYVADIMAASKVYHPKDFNFMVVYNYFLKHSEHYLMHPASKEFILWCVKKANDDGLKTLKKKILKAKYAEIAAKYPPSIFLPLHDLNFSLLEIK